MIIRMVNGITVEKFEWTNKGNMDTVVNKTGLNSCLIDLALFIVNVEL